MRSVPCGQLHSDQNLLKHTCTSPASGEIYGNSQPLEDGHSFTLGQVPYCINSKGNND